MQYEFRGKTLQEAVRLATKQNLVREQFGAIQITGENIGEFCINLKEAITQQERHINIDEANRMVDEVNQKIQDLADRPEESDVFWSLVRLGFLVGGPGATIGKITGSYVVRRTLPKISKAEAMGSGAVAGIEIFANQEGVLEDLSTVASDLSISYQISKLKSQIEHIMVFRALKESFERRDCVSHINHHYGRF